MNKISLFILIFTLSSNFAFSQITWEISKPLNQAKNKLTTSIGYVNINKNEIHLQNISFSIDYARKIWDRDNWFFNTAWASLGIGYWWHFNDGDPLYYIQFNMVSGKRASHFEISLELLYLDQGYTISFNPEKQKNIQYYFTPGYKIGYLLFITKPLPAGLRIGIGFPEIIYCGGVTFF